MHNVQVELEAALETIPSMDACRLCHGTNMGAWKSVPPYSFNGTYLGDKKWRDALFLHYVIDPPDLPSACYG